jgi:hypothetical protein
VRDKTTILDRLLHGDLKDVFLAHLERDFRFRMYNQFSDQIHGIEGDSPIFHDFAVKAEAEIPGHALNRALAARSRFLDWDPAARRLALRSRVAPAVPPVGARRAFLVEPEAMTVNPYWRRDGADVVTVEGGALVKAPPLAWHYAASAPIDFSGVDFASEFCWLRLQMRDVTQPLCVSLFNEATNEIFDEFVVPAGEGAQEIVVETPRAVGRALMIRTGEQTANAQGVFVKAELIASPVAPR